MDEPDARRQRSIAILRKAGIPVYEGLPVIETEDESKHRSVEEIALRAMALCVVALKGEGLERDILNKLIDRFGIANAFTPEEGRFINDANPSERDRIQFCWRYECYWVMLWALGYIESLGEPDTACDAATAVGILQDHGREGFLRNAKLRSQAEILDAADLMFRYHWAVVDARLKGDDPPADIDGGVVMERHYALNWLIGYMNQDWDDISTDT